MGARQRAHKDEGKAPRVGRPARRDDLGDGREDGLGRLERLGRVAEEVLAGGDDEVVDDKGLSLSLATRDGQDGEG